METSSSTSNSESALGHNPPPPDTPQSSLVGVPTGLTRRRLLMAVGFIFLVLLGDRGLAHLLDTLLMQSDLRFSRMYRGVAQADILILGDSRGVNCCYAPDIERRTKQRVFNLSYNGESMAVAEALFEDYVDHHEPPEHLLIEVTALLTHNLLITELMGYVSHSKRLFTLLQHEHPRLATAGRITHLFRFNNELFLRALYYLAQTDQDSINRYQIHKGLIALIDAMEPMKLKSQPANEVALNRLLDHADTLGVRVTLLVSPYWPGYRNKLTNFHDWLTGVRRLVKDRAELLDLSQAPITPEGFADRVHLNETGGRALTSLLIEHGVLGVDP
jgi:hypothetical protein